MNSPRVDLKPLFAVVTLAIGIGFVSALDSVRSVLSPTEAIRDVDWAAMHPRLTDSRPTEVRLPSKVQKFSCYDLNVQAIWQELKRDEVFKEWVGYSDETIDCSDLVEIKNVELNEDRNSEIFVRGKYQLCGGTGNCAVWIFRMEHGKAKTLLAGSDLEGLGDPVQLARTNGYSNILLKDHASASATGYRTYTFDGARYVESRCVYEIFEFDLAGASKRKRISCKEFYRGSR